MYEELQKQMSSYHHHLLMSSYHHHLLDANFWLTRGPSLGLDRFANEAWIGSHPDVTPCDISPLKSFSLYQHLDAVTIPKPQFGMLPKRTFEDIVLFQEIGIREKKQAVMQNETLRKQDIFLLPGLLFKWDFHYHSVPSNTSWVFDQYPDGPYWRQMVMQLVMNRQKTIE